MRYEYRSMRRICGEKGGVGAYAMLLPYPWVSFRRNLWAFPVCPIYGRKGGVGA